MSFSRKNSFKNLTKVSLLMLSIFVMTSNTIAQNFNIGKTSVIFFDSIRNRNIPTEIYYPSVNAGQNEPVSSGNFPVLVYGHGFVMGVSSYENIWEELVPKGYVICFPNTETGITPSHEKFGKDLKFLAAQMQIESLDSNSIFFNALAPKTALMGHSMGGGASFLAAENNTNIQALVNFAAAETNPSAVSAANNISVPSLLFSGDADCVAPPADHQDLMYNALNSDCKTQIKIINGSHCYFAESNFNCNLGESFCNPNPDISKQEQQAVMNDFLSLWLDYTLKGNQNAFNVFNDSLETSNRITYLQNCVLDTGNTVGINKLNKNIQITIFPNPAIEKLNLSIPFDFIDGTVTIFNLTGKKVFQSQIANLNTQIDVSLYQNGVYLIRLNKDSLMQYHKFIKMER